MLAQSFQTAAQLELSERQHAALHRVLTELEQDQIPHLEIPINFARRSVLSTEPGTKWFNMDTWMYNSTGAMHCGTAGCIGGWANHFAGNEVFMFHNLKPALLHRLFNGYDCGKSMRFITPSEAASCLRHYLTTGIVDWKRACTHG